MAEQGITHMTVAERVAELQFAAQGAPLHGVRGGLVLRSTELQLLPSGSISFAHVYIGKDGRAGVNVPDCTHEQARAIVKILAKSTRCPIVGYLRQIREWFTTLRVSLRKSAK